MSLKKIRKIVFDRKKLEQIRFESVSFVLSCLHVWECFLYPRMIVRQFGRTFRTTRIRRPVREKIGVELRVQEFREDARVYFSVLCGFVSRDTHCLKKIFIPVGPINGDTAR